MVYLDRGHKFSLELHRIIHTKMDEEYLSMNREKILTNIANLRERVRGQPHLRNLDHWQEIVSSGDLAAIRKYLIGLDEKSVEMREMGPFLGLVTQEERLIALAHVKAK